MLISENGVLVLQGDSITDCGRARPVGERPQELGDGYAKMVSALLGAGYPERRIRVLNTGISGNTTRDLRARWQEDTLSLNPTWVSIMIGANDVWRHFDRPLNTWEQVGAEEYRENLEWLVARTLPEVEGMILMAPYYMSQCEDDPMRQKMLQYAAIVQETAKANKLPFVDTQRLMDHYFRFYHPHAMSWDCIHPNHVGSMLLAHGLVDAVNYNWNHVSPK